MLHQVDWRICPLPNDLCEKILGAEYFIAHCFKIFGFVVIHRNKDNTIIRKQVSCNFESRINHIEPISMEATIAFSIALHWVYNEVAVLVVSAVSFLEVFTRLGEIVVIDEVIAGVIRRVYVNHLDCAKIVLSENFEYIKIIALNVKIFGIPKIYGSIEVGTESFVGRLICKARRCTLIRPCELIAFLRPVEQVLRQLILEFVEVDSKFRLAVFI